MGARRLAAGLAAVAMGVGLGGCAAQVELPEKPADQAQQATCEAVLAEAPETMLGNVRRDTAGGPGVAWGDPPITVTCGGQAPEKMQPTSECYEVNGVGWWPQNASEGTVFTTIGRDVYVEVGVPSHYGNPSDALVELGPVVENTTELLRPCVG